MSITNGIFITGTDTGVGKTYVACLLARLMRSRGIDAGVMKPAETGCRTRNGLLVPSDGMLLKKAAGVADPLELIVPYRFRLPLAPAAAAGLEGASVRMERILSSFERLAGRHDAMIVEGAGGIMVPLTGRTLYADLAARMNLPVLIVARPGLGTLNHTLLTIEALRSRRVLLHGIVINHAVPSRSGLAERTNPRLLERLSGLKVLAQVRYGARSLPASFDLKCVRPARSPANR